MPKQGKVKVGIIGLQFQADILATSFKIVPEEAEVVAVAAPSAEQGFLGHRLLANAREIERIRLV
jgi:hypothetical protein